MEKITFKHLAEMTKEQVIGLHVILKTSIGDVTGVISAVSTKNYTLDINALEIKQKVRIDRETMTHLKSKSKVTAVFTPPVVTFTKFKQPKKTIVKLKSKVEGITKTYTLDFIPTQSVFETLKKHFEPFGNSDARWSVTVLIYTKDVTAVTTPKTKSFIVKTKTFLAAKKWLERVFKGYPENKRAS